MNGPMYQTTELIHKHDSSNNVVWPKKVLFGVALSQNFI